MDEYRGNPYAGTDVAEDGNCTLGSIGNAVNQATYTENLAKAEAQQREWHDRQVAESAAAVERQLRAAALEGALRSPAVENGADVLKTAKDYLAFLKGES